jgi:hypothetical protein
MRTRHATVSGAVTRLGGVETSKSSPARLAYPHCGHYDVYSLMLW